MLSTSSPRPVQVGAPAPNFKGVAVLDGTFKDISLSSYLEAHHWLVLVFFPKAWSFICPTEIRAFSSRLEEFFYKRSCAVVFCCTDNEHSLKAWDATSVEDGGLGGVHVPMISDCSHRISRDYGVLIEDEGVAQRALFIIDPKGIMRNININDADVGRSVDETQRVVDALIFKDEFGEGCPVDWKKGDRGIDVKTRSSVDGPIEVKARTTWSDWARPKLQRAFSGNSALSVNVIASPRMNNGEKPRSHSNLQSIGHSGEQSPMALRGYHAQEVSQFEAQMAEALSAQTQANAAVLNMRAAIQNQSLNVS